MSPKWLPRLADYLLNVYSFFVYPVVRVNQGRMFSVSAEQNVSVNDKIIDSFQVGGWVSCWPLLIVKT
jgi:hypothetical protein